MFSRIMYLNIGLALICTIMAVNTYDIWKDDFYHIKNDKVVDPTSASKADKFDVPPADLHKRLSPKSSYKEIATLNLFSKDRKEYTAPTTRIDSDATPQTKEDVPQLDSHDITLYGVVLLDGYKKALITDPEAKDRKNATRWVKAKDRIGELTVDAINADSLIFADGNKRYRVLLYDKDKERRSKKSDVTSAKTSLPTVVRSESATTETNPASTNNKTNELNKDTGDDDYIIIETPFGKIKRKK